MLIAMVEPNNGAGVEGDEPPNPCEPIEVAPEPLRTMFTGEVNNCPTATEFVSADHIGVAVTDRMYPAPLVMSVPDSEPLNRPVSVPDEVVGSVRRML